MGIPTMAAWNFDENEHLGAANGNLVREIDSGHGHHRTGLHRNTIFQIQIWDVSGGDKLVHGSGGI